MSENNKLVPRETLLPAERPSLLEQIDSFVTEMGDVVSKSEALIPQAEEFQIDSEVSFQYCDDMRVELQSEAQLLEKRRLNLTRPIDALKAFVADQAKPAIANYNQASAVYGNKAMAWRRAEKEKAEASRREAERIQRETQARLEAEARKKEEAAANLKTEAARARKLQEAQNLRQAAVMTPTAIVEAPAPQTTSSSVVERWQAEVSDPAKFLAWLAEHKEWQGIVTFGKAQMNELAKRFKDNIEVPGVRIYSEEAFRKKATR